MQWVKTVTEKCFTTFKPAEPTREISKQMGLQAALTDSIILSHMKYNQQVGDTW